LCTGGTDHSSSEEVALPFCKTTSAISGLQDTRFYTYDHGIMLTTNDESVEMLPLNSAIILFNLALASHQQGRLLGHEKSLENASHLYSVTAKILSGSIVMKNTSTIILTLLALNNQSKIHHDQCEHIQSVDCLKAVSKMMESVKVIHLVLNEEDPKGFLLNTMLLSVPSAAQVA
jgi:hypothetical protein